jgi:hypothetical protein
VNSFRLRPLYAGYTFHMKLNELQHVALENIPGYSQESFVQPVLGLRNNKPNVERPKSAQALFSFCNYAMNSSQVCLQPCIILCSARLFDSVTGIPRFILIVYTLINILSSL